MVTPHVGVWIETDIEEVSVDGQAVTPHVGVWIETQQSHKIPLRNGSHTSCRCVD